MNAYQADQLRQRTAELSIGASTWHMRGCAGTAAAGRAALRAIDLLTFQVRQQDAFLRGLKETTQFVLGRLPRGGSFWGVARKYLNIFLRSCVTNASIAEFYGIEHIRSWLELPLDSHVAKGIQTCSHGIQLPRWRTIKSLTEDQSAAYQGTALVIAERNGVDRIDLEWCWWRVNPAGCQCQDQ